MTTKKIITAALAIAVSAAWTAAPVFAADEPTKQKVEDKAERAKDKTEAKSESIVDKTKDKARELKDKAMAKVDKADAADVRNAQQALKTKGFDPGPVDGKIGPRTSAALRDFQKKENLKVNGRLDDETKARLTASASTTTPPSASPTTTSPAPSTTTPPSSPSAQPKTGTK